MPALKIKTFLGTQPPTYRYGAYLGSQTVFYSGHKIFVFFWPFSFRKVLSALDFVKIYKVTLIQWDCFFTVTLAPLGSINYLYPVLYCDQTIT